MHPSMGHSGILVAAMFLYILTSKNSEAVKCYICSWNPDDRNNDIIDICSTGNFDPLRVSTHDCEKGCEIVRLKDMNGETEMFYRNCVNENDVVHELVKRNDEEIYTCDSKLCNSAARNTNSTFGILLTLLICLMCINFIST